MDPLIEGNIGDYGSLEERRNQSENIDKATKGEKAMGICNRNSEDDDNENKNDVNKSEDIGNLTEKVEEPWLSYKHENTMEEENEDDEDQRKFNAQKIINDNCEIGVIHKLMDKSFTHKLLRTALADAAYLGVVSTCFV